MLRRGARAFDDFVRVLRIPVRRAHELDPRIPVADNVLLLAVLGGINELVLQHLVAGDAARLPQLANTVETLLVRACLTPG